MVSMKKLRIIIPIFIVFLMLSSTITIAEETPNENKEDQRINIQLLRTDEESFNIELDVTAKDLETFNESLLDVYFEMQHSTDGDSPFGSQISKSEWDNIIIKFYHMIDTIKDFAGDDFPAEEIKSFTASLFEYVFGWRYLFRQPLISIGIGLTLIPFYEYETAIGKFVRPVIMQHILGFSATCKLNPFVLGFPFYKMGNHRIRTFFFEGLFINIGDLAINRIVGPHVLLGFGMFTGFA